MSDATTYKLEAFDITHRLGIGGMGEVWAGIHRASKAPVAIKIVTAKLANEARYRELFHREVQAMASLDHPGIIHIFDYGELHEDQTLPAGWSPGQSWLAMELAAGGSLEEADPVADWPQLKLTLLGILDALAHAHARGVVHRDLKPGNILLGLGSEGGRHLLLTDFGIAHLLDPGESQRTADVQSVSAGTPLYMAPEQIQGRWRDYGPWTDLYALGCLAYEFASGQSPFEAATPLATAMQHLTMAAPTLEPRFEVPEGFHHWVATLMEKDFSKRPRYAADAARALASLPGDLSKATLPAPGALSRDHQIALEPTFLSAPSNTMTLPMATLLLDENFSLPELTPSRLMEREKPLGEPSAHGEGLHHFGASSWRRPEQIREFSALPGTGQGLFGLRDIPFVDRDEHRELIWQALGEVHERRETRVIVITSEPGLGKSHLMRWMAERAHELAAAQIWTARHSPIAGPADGLPRMLMTQAGCMSLSRTKIYERIRDSLAQLKGARATGADFADEAAAIVELIRPAYLETSPCRDVPRITIESPEQRYAIIASHLALHGAQRPLMLCIDDVQWGHDALAFVKHLLSNAHTEPIPALILLSARLDMLNSRPQEASLLWELTTSEKTRHIELAPLGDKDHRTLIGELLGLHEDLKARIAKTTAGSPLKAVQLISHWVTTSRLVATQQGYILEDKSSREEVVDSHSMALFRIQSALEQATNAEAAWPCLEAAAAIGLDIDRDEWQTLCGHLNYPLHAAWLESLSAAGIIRIRRGGWSFQLAIHREALERHARRHDRWRRIHQGLAEIVVDNSDNGTCIFERRARHLLAGDSFEEALEPLWIAIQARANSSAYGPTLMLIDLSRQAADGAGIGQRDPRRLRLFWQRAETLRFTNQVREAMAELESLESIAPKTDMGLQGHSSRVMAGLQAAYGQVDLALEFYEKAEKFFAAAGDWSGVARALHGQGWMHVNSCRFDAAHDCYVRGRLAAQKGHDERYEAWCVMGVGESLNRRGDPEAEPFCELAFQSFEHLGVRSGMALALVGLGNCARRRGAFTLAAQHYHHAQEIAQQIQHVLAHYSNYLLSLNAIQQGNIDEASRELEPLLVIQTKIIATTYVFGNYALAMTIAAARGDQQSWDHYKVLMDRSLERHGNVIIIDHVELYQMSKSHWELAQDPLRAEQAEHISRLLARRLQMPSSP